MTTFDDLCDQSVSNLSALTQAHKRIWRFGEEQEWKLDQDTGKLIFIFDNDAIVSADAQIVGTFNSKNNSWKWAWDNLSISPELSLDSKVVRQYGFDHGLEELTWSDLDCPEATAWTLAAIACKLCNSQGVYRGPAGTTYVFINFREVKINKKDSDDR